MAQGHCNGCCCHYNLHCASFRYFGAWLESRAPLILCGPPGSGKTVTLTSVLQSLQSVVLASLNFSLRTTPELIMKTFAQYCAYVRKGKDVFLSLLKVSARTAG